MTREADGSLALGGSGTPVDWLVRMVRFDQNGQDPPDGISNRDASNDHPRHRRGRSRRAACEYIPDNASEVTTPGTEDFGYRGSGALDTPGQRMPAEDSYIAATARRHGSVIATGNDWDFKRPGVKVFNPFNELSQLVVLPRSWIGRYVTRISQLRKSSSTVSQFHKSTYSEHVYRRSAAVPQIVPPSHLPIKVEMRFNAAKKSPPTIAKPPVASAIDRRLPCIAAR